MLRVLTRVFTKEFPPAMVKFIVVVGL